MAKNVGAEFPEDLYWPFCAKAFFFPGGKTGLLKEAARIYLEANPLAEEEVKVLETLKAKKIANEN